MTDPAWQPRFIVVSHYPNEDNPMAITAFVWDFPYWNEADYEEQRERALIKYEEVKDTNPNKITTLSRLAIQDVEAGDPTPTLLRKSNEPDYSYEGFSGI